MRRSFAFIATAWGPIKGGINSLNMDLCTAIAAEGVQVVCIVEGAEEYAILDAKTKGIVLIPLGGAVRETSVADEVVELVRREGFTSVSWWIGHDMITGNVALRAAKVSGSRAAVFHHMHHLTYKSFEGEAAEKVQKREIEQRELFQAAHLVVAVGPSLMRSAADLIQGGSTRPPVLEIIPGLAHVEPIGSPQKFNAVIIGRFEDSSAKTKQLDLSVAAFSLAAKDATGPLGPHPLLTVLGSTEKMQRRLSELVERHAGRRVELHLLPFETDRNRLLSEIARKSVVMMLSWYEAFGLVAWEAIAAGVPLIISRATGAYQQLRNMLKEETDGFVEAVDIKATANPTELRHEDIEQVATALVRIAGDSAGARERAVQLRRRLLEANITWKACAQRLLEACNKIDALGPAAVARRNHQDLICADYIIAASNTISVALCLIVDRPDDVRASVGSLAERIARKRETSSETADGVLARGFDPLLDPPEVCRELVDLALKSPLRAYAIVARSANPVTLRERRANLFSGLFKARFAKHDLPLRSIRGASDKVTELAVIVQKEWAATRTEPVPDIIAEPLSKESLLVIATMMARAAASAAEVHDRTVFDLLRIKFAHIYDIDQDRNYLSDDDFP